MFTVYFTRYSSTVSSRYHKKSMIFLYFFQDFYKDYDRNISKHSSKGSPGIPPSVLPISRRNLKIVQYEQFIKDSFRISTSNPSRIPLGSFLMISSAILLIISLRIPSSISKEISYRFQFRFQLQFTEFFFLPRLLQTFLVHFLQKIPPENSLGISQFFSKTFFQGF